MMRTMHIISNMTYILPAVESPDATEEGHKDKKYRSVKQSIMHMYMYFI